MISLIAGLIIGTVIGWTLAAIMAVSSMESRREERMEKRERFCDFCGQKITGRWWTVAEANVGLTGPRSYEDLCEDCMSELMFIGSKREAERDDQTDPE